MKVKLEKEVNVTKGNERLILTTAIILIVVAIIYTISRYAGQCH
jgi:hypothetical protein